MYSPTRMKVLITGGAGFIGSHLSEVYLRRGDSVHVMDDLSTGSAANIAQLKKQERLASESEANAADGISIMDPISSVSSNGVPFARNSARTSSTNAFACCNSSTPEIIGYIIFTFPATLARRIALSCARKISFSTKQNRMARHPRKGFIS